MSITGDISVEAANDVNAASTGFSVHLANFDGPFDLLLQLISRHKMDVTEVSLSIVTDEFISFIRGLEASGEGWELGQATEFLVVAATLLDIKAARLLPSGDVEDEEDLALLEARDLLFARLLQYRAFKEIAATFSERIASACTPMRTPLQCIRLAHSPQNSRCNGTLRTPQASAYAERLATLHLQQAIK